MTLSAVLQYTAGPEQIPHNKPLHVNMISATTSETKKSQD